jgi:hypothetical protein
MVTHFLAALVATGLTVGADADFAVDPTLESAARAYRMQVYETFHLDRPEFDLRRAEWRRIEQSWQAAGKPDRDVPALLHWLADATTRSQVDSIGPLPEAPKIVAALKVEKDGAAISRQLAPRPTDRNAPAAGPLAKPATAEKSDSSTVADTKSPPDAAAIEPGKATPASSRRTFDSPAIEEKKPDETAPVSTPIVPDPEAKDDAAARPTAPAGAAAWFHDLGQELGEDLNYLGLTLAWKRESKP